jgi:hypothetical protein
MAATNEQNDYVHSFLSLLESIQGLRPQFNIKPDSRFEISFWTLNLATYFSFADTLKPDLIIIELGDNVKPDTAAKYNFGSYYYAMLSSLKSNHPQVKIIATTKFWVNETIDTMIINAGRQAGAIIANLATIPYDTLNYAYTQQHFDNSGVGIHPSDIGMKRIAEVMISALVAGNTDVPQLHNYQPKFTLCQNYPNPFNPSTSISFNIPSKAYVLLKVFDIIGREVAVIVSEELTEGNYLRRWDATGLTSGAYFCRLQVGSFVNTKKLILLR